MSDGPLAGIRVLDIATMLAGPYGATLLGDEVEIMEVEVVRGCRLTSGPLMEVKLPKGVLVAALKRGEKLAIPGGRDTVEAGDHVLLITTSGMASKLTEFLEA